MNKIMPYCPQCKSNSIEFKEDKLFVCQHCGFQLYHNVAGATAVILHRGLDILFTVRNEDPQKGKLDLAGGFIDPNETVEEGIARELKEELQIEINTKKLVYVGSEPNVYHYKNVDYHTIDLYFTLEIDQEINSFNKEEINSLKYINFNDLNIRDLAFTSHQNFFKKHQKKLLW